ncbi:Fc receptor-like protein 6 isoform X2 [Hippopotamus amphibius kiboko]|uniref:Fc receptor-like protein 6 isoform X2 n=1 Tax=Hippopotamus amphibius kiboko TaxID=575201 RepID=UPI002593854B|nr:Fc receptor-like protein 6 isoform X2 [Hippopotamus amphibius kiboko]
MPGLMLLWMAALLSVPCVGKTAWLSLRVQPYPVFEGDLLILQCRERKNAALSQVTFYRNRKFLHFSKDNQPLSMGAAMRNSSGRYSCSGQLTYKQSVGKHTSETVTVQVQELFPPPVLRAYPSHEVPEGSPVTLRCQTKLHSLRSAWRLFFSFHKEGHTLQDRGLHPELCIPAAQEGDSGLYWCEAALEHGWVQKRSPPLEVRVWAPVSRPRLSLRPTSLVVGELVEMLCEAEQGSPPILYSLRLNGDILRNHMAPHGGAASFLFPVVSQQDAGNYSCEAENAVSKETSKPGTLSVHGLRVLSAPNSSNWLVPWLPASLLGVMVIATALLVYFRPWRKTGPLPARNLPPAPDGEQHALYANVHYQKENDEACIYSVIHTIPEESED